MSELNELIASEIADFFAGFGGPGEPDIQNGEAQRLLTERVLSVLALRERAEPVAYADQQAFRNFKAGVADKEWMWAQADVGLVPVFVEAPLAPVAPMQPVVIDAQGTLRFKENPIVRKLLDYSTRHGYGLNEMALEDFDAEDRMQLAQLIGYSLSGYGTLSYVTDESYARASMLQPVSAPYKLPVSPQDENKPTKN
ncbi:hypothetical protein [Cronobacter malonaticus]|uniref:hypothetical protein n=1 Tax=Cronobacter malonaticus TaxID=413503 RepID=UPI0018F89C2D|nr:hypothetical protein [Cronobacter malonaticus]